MKDLLLTILISIVTFCVLFLMTIVFFIPILISRKFYYRILPSLCKILLFTLGVNLKFEGQLPNNTKSYVMMISHASFVEVFIIPVIMNGRQFTGITAKSNLKIPILGFLIKMARILPVDRSNSEKAIESLNNVEQLMKEGIHMVLAPEGTRSLTGKINPLKKGGFHLALNTQTDILPIGIAGAFDYKPKNRWTIKPGKIVVRIGHPIPVKNYNKTTLSELAKTTENQLKELIK